MKLPKPNIGGAVAKIQVDRSLIIMQKVRLTQKHKKIQDNCMFVSHLLSALVLNKLLLSQDNSNENAKMYTINKFD